MTKRPGNDFGGRFSRKSANAPIDEVSPIKRSNNRLRTHGSISKSEMFVSVGTKGIRTNFHISAPNDSVRIDREPIKWTLEYVNKKFKLLSGLASETTDYVSLGQKIYMIIFKDGRKLRWNPGDITEKELRAIKRITNLKGRPKDRVFVRRS